MPEHLRVERLHGVDAHLQLTTDQEGGVFLAAPSRPEFKMTPADLLWLVTTGGPAMIALLGGPLAIKGGTAPSEAGRP